MMDFYIAQGFGLLSFVLGAYTFLQKNDAHLKVSMLCLKMRLAFIFGAICWISHNIVVQSVGGVMLETVVIIANLATIYRLSLHKNR